MSVVSVRARSFILALFIRDDGERFLLGDNGYDFIDSQLHFSANTIENDEVEKQGADGTMLAGQVRRASVQTFDGYVGDATTPKEEIEQMRREFIAFFAKDHHFRVIYVDCNRNAWQRKGGYLVDAPEVKELWQIHPEYHVGLNFEDVNYYEYDENAEGQEILANIMKVPLSSDVEGGLVWDEDGAVSEDATVIYDGDTATASGTIITVSDAVEAPLSDFKLKGETSQNGTPTPDAPVAVQTVTGENVVKISDGQGNEQSYEVNLGKNLFDKDNVVNGIPSASDGSITSTSSAGRTSDYIPVMPNTSYSHTGHPAGWATIAWYKADKSFIQRVDNITTTTSPSGAAYARVSCAQSDLGTCQFEAGEPTSYAAYFDPIELCKIGDYQDYVYKSGGKWYVRKAVGELTLTGDNSEGWSSTGTNVFATANGAITGSKYPPLALCRYATFNPVQSGVTGALANGEFAVQYNNGNNSRVFFKNTAISDVSGFVAWVSENTPTIYYALVTPTDTEITNAALVAQLEAILWQGKTYAGTNNITTAIAAGNEQGELEITYYTSYEAKVVGGGYVWEEGGSGGPTVIVNESISAVSPVWTVYGPALNPQLENATNGDVIEYVGLIAEGQTLVIDMGEQTAKLDGLNVISNVTGDFISLESGANTLLYSAGNDAPESEIGWSEIVG